MGLPQASAPSRVDACLTRYEFSSLARRDTGPFIFFADDRNARNYYMISWCWPRVLSLGWLAGW